MGLFEYFAKSDHKWFWFFATFVASLIPVACRFIASLASEINALDLKDVLFAGLALNLSNLNLVGDKTMDKKNIIVYLSVILLIIIAVILGIYFANENKLRNISIMLDLFSITFVGASVYVSYSANNYVFENFKS